MSCPTEMDLAHAVVPPPEAMTLFVPVHTLPPRKEGRGTLLALCLGSAALTGALVTGVLILAMGGAH